MKKTGPFVINQHLSFKPIFKALEKNFHTSNENKKFFYARWYNPTPFLLIMDQKQ